MRCLLIIFFSIIANLGFADGFSHGRASWNPEHPRVLKFTPVTLGLNNRLTLVTPQDLEQNGIELTKHLKFIYTSLQQVFGEIPKLNIQVHLMPEQEYYELTGAPVWTNAIFYKDEILIPIRENTSVKSINKTIRHEFTHAVIDALSDGKCPGWLDEGLAQWSEGEDNPALEPALKRWLENNPPVKLSELQGGFTGLAKEKVPAAYAQSLFATTAILSTFGFEKLSNYFENLKNNSEDAFLNSFDINEAEFEKGLNILLKNWKTTSTALGQ